MMKATQFGMRIFVALLVTQGLFGCVLRGHSADETAAVAEQEDSLAGIENDPKPSEVQTPKPETTAQPLPLTTATPDSKTEKKVETLTPVAVAAAATPTAPPIVTETPAPVKAPAKSATPSKKKKPEPKASGKASAKGAFKTTKKACPMKEKPNSKAATLTSIPKGRKIWVEKAGAYYKVSRVKGAGYLAGSCF